MVEYHHLTGETTNIVNEINGWSIEMEMFHQASMKLGLDRAVLAHARHEKGGGGDENGNRPLDESKLTIKEIDELLKRGAYDVFREDDTEQNEFVEADIDAILQRRSHKLIYDKNGISSGSSTLGTFSKASFVSTDTNEDVDINDPDFWKKAVGLSATSGGILKVEESHEFLPQQRVRKQALMYTEGPMIDEKQLKDYLKPISRYKLQRMARAEEAERKRALREAQKEALLREKQEKEDAKKQKLLEEARQKADPRLWGGHGRDRVVRLLTQYGCGRWERIKSELGKSAMDVRDLESFSKSYITQCGMAIVDIEPHKNDPPYVLKAVTEAREILADVANGTKTLDIPATLCDERFMAKLKAGLAKKALTKLDAMAKLTNLVREMLGKSEKVKDQQLVPMEEIDQIFSLHTIDELSKLLPFGDVRPNWARSCPWWDFDCDNHLVLGIFRHGYGRFDLIRNDPELVFKSKLQKLHEKKSTAVGLELNSGEVNGSTPPGDVKSEPLNDVEMDGVRIDESMEDGKGVDDDEGQDEYIDEENDGGDEAGEGETGPSTGKSANNKTLSPDDLPDPRHLNRLFIWLITNEMARAKRAELQAAAEKLQKEKRTKAREEARKANALAKAQEMATKAAKKSAEESFNDASLLSPDLDTPLTLSGQESLLIDAVKNSLDYHALTSVFKTNVLGLKKCEYIVSLPVQARPVGFPVGSSQSSVDAVRTNARHSSDNTQMEVDAADVDAEQQVKASSTISEFDSIRLGAALILYGAPIFTPLKASRANALKYLMGFTTASSLKVDQNEESKSKDEEWSASFSWKNIKAYSGVNVTDEALEAFYANIWMPFCMLITHKNILSSSQQKYLVPNPLLPLSDHHFTAKGLCQLFVIRQQILRTIGIVLKTCLNELLEYLRSPNGRVVENMPIWWCPWIHDLGLLVGIEKHGFLMLQKIFSDSELPFNQKYLRAFIQKVFISGTSFFPPVGRFDLRNEHDCEEFLKFALIQYPDIKDLELRIVRILEEVTKNLPPEHPAKLIISYQQLRSIVNYSSIEEAAEAGTDGPSQKMKTDGRTNRSSARPPAISLKSFIHTSRKRRKLYVTSYHPDCFAAKEEG